MKISMSEIKKKSQNLESQLEKQNQEVVEDGKEYKDVEGKVDSIDVSTLDSDVADAVAQVKKDALTEVKNDISSLEKEMDRTKKEMAEYANETTDKIKANDAASRKLSEVKKYGEGAADSAKSSLQENTRIGEGVLDSIQKSIDNSEEVVKNVKDSL